MDSVHEPHLPSEDLQTGLSAPSEAVHLQCIVVLAQGGLKPAVHGGLWTEGNLMLTQYKLWKNDTSMLNTSTAQLRSILMQNHVRSHPAIQK